ncbi:MAG: ComF family protein [Gammaproteobacteria bacterium]
MLDKLIPLYTRIINTLMPWTCLLCGGHCTTDYAICLPCYQSLPILSHACYRCAKELPNGQTLCGACLIDPPPYFLTHALFPYDYPIGEMIIQLKFQHKLGHALALGKLMGRKIKEEWYVDATLPDVILPVPLHVGRLKERGFNQAVEVAKYVAREIKVAVDIAGIERVKATTAQSQLTVTAREVNLKDAFRVGRNYTGLHVAVLDDVMTTGNTVKVLSDALVGAGARRVDIWCCARRL